MSSIFFLTSEYHTYSFLAHTEAQTPKKFGLSCIILKMDSKGTYIYYIITNNEFIGDMTILSTKINIQLVAFWLYVSIVDSKIES